MRKLFLGLVLAFSSLCYSQEQVTPAALASWDFYGEGTVLKESHGQVLLKEDEVSKGVVLVSPKSYSDHVIMRYKVMALTPATVLVAILNASDHGNSTDLTIPKDYDGRVQFWGAGCENYFFAFNTAAHNNPPFVRKFSKEQGRIILDKHKGNIMQSGIYYQVEVGRKGTDLWMKVNGKTILKTKDPNPYSAGHVALRIRGTATEYAACLIKDLEIIDKGVNSLQ
jgi:hypothetical protein